jgi:hypothetical protein
MKCVTLCDCNCCYAATSSGARGTNQGKFHLRVCASRRAPLLLTRPCSLNIHQKTFNGSGTSSTVTVAVVDVREVPVTVGKHLVNVSMGMRLSRRVI